MTSDTKLELKKVYKKQIHHGEHIKMKTMLLVGLKQLNGNTSTCVSLK